MKEQKSWELLVFRNKVQIKWTDTIPNQEIYIKKEENCHSKFNETDIRRYAMYL